MTLATFFRPHAGAILGTMVAQLLLGCAAQHAKPDAAPPAQASAPAAPNPLLEKWTGPWGGVPPFGRFKVTDIKPALEAAIAENLAEIDPIAGHPPPAPSPTPI